MFHTVCLNLQIIGRHWYQPSLYLWGSGCWGRRHRLQRGSRKDLKRIVSTLKLKETMNIEHTKDCGLPVERVIAYRPGAEARNIRLECVILVHMCKKRAQFVFQIQYNNKTFWCEIENLHWLGGSLLMSFSSLLILFKAMICKYQTNEFRR